MPLQKKSPTFSVDTICQQIDSLSSDDKARIISHLLGGEGLSIFFSPVAPCLSIWAQVDSMDTVAIAQLLRAVAAKLSPKAKETE